MLWDSVSTYIEDAAYVFWMRTRVSSLRKLMQTSQGRRLHRSRHFSVTWTVEAVRTMKETMGGDRSI